MNTCSEVFSVVKEYCSNEMPATPYSLWIKDIECVELTQDSATLMTKTELRRTIIESRYLPLIQKAFNDVMGFEINIILKSNEEEEKNSSEHGGVKEKIRLNNYTNDIILIFHKEIL